MLEVSLEQLESWLQRTPVVARFHPLLPLCFSSVTQVSVSADTVLAALAHPSRHISGRILVSAPQPDLVGRFPEFIVAERPDASIINRFLPENLQYARANLLTTKKVAAEIERDVVAHGYETVVVMLVDGLSYADTIDWPCELQPCFVDGPSVTYRFQDDDKQYPSPVVGFPAIVGQPTIYDRLYAYGYRNARGYTYWNRDNKIADYLFRGVPSKRVPNFETVCQQLATEQTLRFSYIQIMREGLDGLAHSKRELRQQEVDAAVRGILDDVRLLLAFFQEHHLYAGIYLTADHGILWKTTHDLRRVANANTIHPRYCTEMPSDSMVMERTCHFEGEEKTYYLFKYPFIGAAIRANDSGVHGGLSYQESIVPFAKFEVKR